jgi:Rrf2 family transcriptional regulator, cysteine metabolism repressor
MYFPAKQELAMKLSTKTRYGLRAVIEIARKYRNGPAKRREIAAVQDLSDSYLENILIMLKNQRLIETTRGANGGYVLCRKPSAITVLEIVNALEGPPDLVECVGSPSSCKKSSKCAAYTVWKSLTESWISVLGSVTLQDLVDKEDALSNSTYSI